MKNFLQGASSFRISIILAIMLLLVTLNSIYYFFSIAKVKAIEWLVFNACAPSNIVFLIGFIIFLFTKNRMVINMAILPMFFFGGLGLFLFPWTGFNIVAQISHIVMTLNVWWAVWETFRLGDFRVAFIGLLLGVLCFSPFIGFQQSYANAHSKDLVRILGVDEDNFKEKYGIKKNN